MKSQNNSSLDFNVLVKRGGRVFSVYLARQTKHLHSSEKLAQGYYLILCMRKRYPISVTYYICIWYITCNYVQLYVLYVIICNRKYYSYLYVIVCIICDNMHIIFHTCVEYFLIFKFGVPVVKLCFDILM